MECRRVSLFAYSQVITLLPFAYITTAPRWGVSYHGFIDNRLTKCSVARDTKASASMLPILMPVFPGCQAPEPLPSGKSFIISVLGKGLPLFLRFEFIYLTSPVLGMALSPLFCHCFGYAWESFASCYLSFFLWQAHSIHVPRAVCSFPVFIFYYFRLNNICRA